MRLRFTLYPYNLPAICFSQWPFALSHRPVSFSSRLRTYMAIVSVYPERCADNPLSFHTHWSNCPKTRRCISLGVDNLSLFVKICCCSLYYLVGIRYGRHQSLTKCLHLQRIVNSIYNVDNTKERWAMPILSPPHPHTKSMDIGYFLTFSQYNTHF